MVIRIRHITLILTLLLLGGLNHVDAAVTYHILTLPFTTYENDLVSTHFTGRVEALRCTSNVSTVSLPVNFRSPLVTSYTYYAASDIEVSSSRVQIYANISTTYYTYAIKGEATPLEENATVADGSDIYVVYTYDNATSPVDLNGGKLYNIKVGNRFLAFNKTRNNRLGGVPVSYVTSEQLVSDDFTTISTAITGGYKEFYFLFKFTGNDPYQITIETAYDRDDTFMEGNNGEKGMFYKEYRGSSVFAKMGSGGSENMWLASDAHKRWYGTASPVSESKPGNFRGNNSEMNPIFNSFALLSIGDNWVFAGSKMNVNGNNWQPNASGQSAYLIAGNDNGRNPRVLYRGLNVIETSPPNLHEAKRYRYHVTSPLTGADITAVGYWSEYAIENDDPHELSNSLIPDALRRKYCEFTGFYSDAAHTHPITTFAEAREADDGTSDGYVEVYLTYRVVGLPFETLSKGGLYTSARWYTLKSAGSNNNICFNSTTLFKTDETSDAASYSNQFAFIGDPYELEVISREASQNASTNHYVGITAGSTDGTPLNHSATASDGYRWEIVSDATAGSIVLREFNTVSVTPRYWGWASDQMTYASTATRITVSNMPQCTYTYHIVDNNGNVAVKHSILQDITRPLNITMLPENIVSPFILTAPLKFFTSQQNDYDSSTDVITETPTSDDDIYVRYDYEGADTYTAYNVRLNGQYIYHSDGSILSNASPTAETLATDAYLWDLNLSDPYRMRIRNKAAGIDKYVNISGDLAASNTLEFTTTEYGFITKSSSVSGAFEVMAATGDDANAASSYYNIGRDDTYGVKLYRNDTHAHGSEPLRFVLYSTGEAPEVTYYLIDKQNKKLMEFRSRAVNLGIPVEYQSPLVTKWHYWQTSNMTIIGGSYTVTSGDEITSVSAVTDGDKIIYVTYDVTPDVNLRGKAGVKMYRLKFLEGVAFKQEDGSDGINAVATKPVYPYANGDQNLYVYGAEQLETQLMSASTTRARWPWYLESPNNIPDPYHVAIGSYSTEANLERKNIYLHTYKPADHTSVVTGGRSAYTTGFVATEYMILGTADAYRLLTTEEIYDGSTTERRWVTSFEQYWKNNPTVQELCGITKNTVAPNESQITSHITPLGWHSYTEWARSAPYTASGKRWTQEKHWFQTVDMGTGTFQLEEMGIDPVMVLLDRHGWEITRKPLPTNADTEAERAQKLADIRAYESPMVKTYHWWATGDKATGYHKYRPSNARLIIYRYNAGTGLWDNTGRTNTDCMNSTSLTDIPYDHMTTNQGYGNHEVNKVDLYVTYDVKDEYANSFVYDYDNETITTSKGFLIQQGRKYAVATDATTLTATDLPAGGLADVITSVTGDDDSKLWKIHPNLDIDTEMGYALNTSGYTSKPSHEPWNEADTKALYKEKRANDFDPYNVRIESAAQSGAFFKTNATGAELGERSSMVATYSGLATLSLGSPDAITCTKGGYDNTDLKMTNCTFMVVQDANGNMRIVPRFDHGQYLTNLASVSLSQTAADAGDDGTGSTQTTIMMLPIMYTYVIKDNSGNESLRYQRGGDAYPAIPDHFKSPFASDFTFYSDAACETKITQPLADAGLTGNTVYVRYIYNSDNDMGQIMQGKWVTMTLNTHDVKYSTTGTDGAGVYYDSDPATKPATVDDDDRTWQWKFLESPSSTPDPYCVYLFNRSKTDGTVINHRFAILSHTSGGYALVKAGDGDYTYKFLQGKDAIDKAATFASESGFTAVANTFTGTKSQVILTDEVAHTYRYKVLTNSSGGVMRYALDATHDEARALGNDFKPELPEAAQSPLLNTNQYSYWLSATGTDADGYTAVSDQTYTLLGIYDDQVYVRYSYNANHRNFMVPNSRNAVGSYADAIAVASDSHPAPFDISGNLWYNLIWETDYMMNSSLDNSMPDHELSASDACLWQMSGGDPYAITISNYTGNKHLYSTLSAGVPQTCSLADGSATTFMLLRKTGYDYGVLAMTGLSGYKLNDYTGAMTALDAAPTKYIPFALATLNVFYQVAIKNTSGSGAATIPYRSSAGADLETKDVSGTTVRNLTGYALDYSGSNDDFHYDAGKMSLGDAFSVPNSLRRAYCSYTFFIDHITSETDEAENDLDYEWMGRELTHLPSTNAFFNKKVYVNVLYEYKSEDNPVFAFADDASTTKWFTLETRATTPWLANYIYNRGTLAAAEGREDHATNEYLWAAEGDPYGFYIHSRYATKNHGGWGEWLSTGVAPDAGGTLTLKSTEDNYRVFEMMPSNFTDFFRLHPVANTGATTLYVSNSEGTVTLSATPADWKFGLDASQMKPYADYTGYVGGLTAAGLTAYNDASTLTAKQSIVYDNTKIVQLTQGYYSIHDHAFYVSGYTHKTEQDNNINLHYHEYAETQSPTRFGDLPSGSFDETNATRGDLPLVAALYDPASIFYVNTPSDSLKTFLTQGLYVNTNGTGTKMSSVSEDFVVQDIGAATLTIRKKQEVRNIKSDYLAPPTSGKTRTIGTGSNNELTDETKWFIQKVGDGINELPLGLRTNNGGDGNYYATLYLPFDVLLPSDATAYVCTVWNTSGLTPISISTYNTEANSCPADYRGSDRFVPAGVAVIVRTTDSDGRIDLTIPTTTPSTTTATAINAVNIFTGEYLEQKLSSGNVVYTFGLPYSGTSIDVNGSTGAVTYASVEDQAKTGVGFYINANPNKEDDALRSNWTRNNWYVYNNKLYYRASGVGAREKTRGVEFVPVIFDDKGGEEPDIKDNSDRIVGDGCVYDLQGRKVATKQQVDEGTWRQILRPGIYIINGKKIRL